MKVPHDIWLQLAQWFQRRFLKIHTHTFLHTRTQQLRVVPDEKMWTVGGGGALKAKYYSFVGRGSVGGGDWRGFFFFFFFQSGGQLAFVKMYNFLQVMVLLKNAVCPNGICWNEKKVPIFRRGLSRKNLLCECHGGGVD